MYMIVQICKFKYDQAAACFTSFYSYKQDS
jgi:hypothetical protein